VLKLGKEMGGIIFGREGKLGWENEWCAKNGFSRQKIGGIMRRRAIRKENPGQVGNPIWRGTPCP
jgi:hypothetical protein